jgi:AraC-like DNA-binding protein/mannose-6-phosphate isomerase-like protein (cupin superfamily)
MRLPDTLRRSAMTADPALQVAIEDARLEIGRCGEVTMPPGAAVGPRRIGDFELFWVLGGELRLELSGGDIRLSPGAGGIIPPGARHRMSVVGRRLLRLGFVHVTCRPAATAQVLLRLPRTWTPPDDPTLAGILAGLLREVTLREPDSPAARILLRTALHLVARQELSPEGDRDLPVLASRLLAAVRSRWRRSPRWMPDRAALAALVSSSEASVGRAFQTAFGCGVVAAVRAMQIERAGRLLQQGTSVADAAAAVGFVDCDTFSRRFRYLYGLRPREAARRARAGTWFASLRLRRITWGAGQQDPDLPRNHPAFPGTPAPPRLNADG